MTTSARDSAHLLRRAGTQRLPRVSRAVAAGTLSGTVVPVYLDGDTSVALPARYVGGPVPVAGDAVWVWRGRRVLLVLGLPAAVQPYRSAAGTLTVSLPNSSPSTTQAVSFPAGRFSQPPILSLTNCGGTGSSNVILQAQAAPTTSGFTLLVLHRDSGSNFGSGQSVVVHWSALQMRSNAAVG